MFSSAHRETHVVRLRAELAATREEALRLHSEFHQAASSERPAVELAAAAVPEEHPRLRLDVALLRSWIDRRGSKRGKSGVISSLANSQEGGTQALKHRPGRPHGPRRPPASP